jgi:hypothetical protein
LYNGLTYVSHIDFGWNPRSLATYPAIKNLGRKKYNQNFSTTLNIIHKMKSLLNFYDVFSMQHFQLKILLANSLKVTVSIFIVGGVNRAELRDDLAKKQL